MNPFGNREPTKITLAEETGKKFIKEPPKETLAQAVPDRVLNALTDGRPDFSRDVCELAADTDNLVWFSSDPEKFEKHGKINFLHFHEIDDKGIFTLTVIKPGTKTVYTVDVPKESCSDINFAITQANSSQQPLDWDKKQFPEGWNNPKGEVDGASYLFKRFMYFGKHKLRWMGNHTNKGNIVEVDDHLAFNPED